MGVEGEGNVCCEWLEGDMNRREEADGDGDIKDCEEANEREEAVEDVSRLPKENTPLGEKDVFVKGLEIELPVVPATIGNEYRRV